jgi:hypothetical protein
MARERQRFKVACIGDLPVGQMRLVEVNGREVGVIRLHSVGKRPLTAAAVEGWRRAAHA